MSPFQALAPHQRFVKTAVAILGREAVLTATGELATYEHDGYMTKARPLAVCFPTTSEEVAALLRLATTYGISVTPRGAGTGLSGGATAVGGGVVISTSRMNRILHIDADNLRATVQPGVVNSDLSRAAAPFGLYYAPDPSSQTASTIGGNVAENAGGPHCLAYGVTTNHVLGMEVVLADGTLHQFGACQGRAELAGYDLTGLTTGGEGNLAFVTAITVRLMPRAEAVSTLLALFSSVRHAGAASSAIIAAGIIPAALEFIDATTIGALEKGGFRDYPPRAEAVLLIELEGLEEQVADDTRRVREVLLAGGAFEVRSATAADERARLWAGRKGALAALGRLAPNYYIQDGVVPRSRLVDVLMDIQELARREHLLIANVFHAGDGNLHPNILYDGRTPGLTERVIEAGAEILRYCVDVGGTLSGEHGVGLEKQEYLDWVFSPEDQQAQRRLKHAFDPGEVLNPGKPFSGPLRST
ncbi:MAG TPA: FAD-linked oxidase C-terminal domain-containing protein [Chloroflexota bacterium]|nr:FAD-linked oxidase C-terminal domain-containing protein [Chloroflexota bacterium]